MEKTGQERHRAFIVGGSSGIGRAVSIALARKSYSLLIHGGSNAENLASVCAEASAAGVSVKGFLSPIQSPAEFIHSIPSETSPDILVVCFGPVLSASLATTSSGDWESMAMTNLALPGALVSLFGPQMAKRGFGRIVLFGGTNTDQIRGFSEIAAYSAAKTGLGVLAKSAAREWGKFNVVCNVLCPGYVDTESSTFLMRKDGIKRMPGNRMQTAENIADLAVSLLLERENGLNGAILSCASGM